MPNPSLFACMRLFGSATYHSQFLLKTPSSRPSAVQVGGDFYTKCRLADVAAPLFKFATITTVLSSSFAS